MLTITAININAINPTEGVPFGSAASPAQIATFDVNNFIGLDESSQYSAVIGWGDGSQSAGLGPVTISFVADLGNGNAEYAVNSYHTYAEATTTANPDTLTVTLADNTGPGTLQSQSGPVQVNDAPLQNSFTPVPINAAVGFALTNITIGQFIDTNPLATASGYSVQVNWGDGQFGRRGTVVPFKTSTQLGGAGVEFTIEATHNYTTTGTFTVTTTINDIGGSTLTETSTVNVFTSSSISTITVNAINPTEGTPFGSAGSPQQIATFDVNNYTGVDESGKYSAVINWGDGSQSAGTGPVTIQFIANLGSGKAKYGVFSFHTYAEATTSSNPYTLTVTLADNTGPASIIQSASGPVQVNDAPLDNTFPSTTINATVGVPLTNVTIGQFIDTNPLATASDYAVSVNWGDGQFSAGTVVPFKTSTQLGGTGVEFTVEASHAYSTAGTFTISTLVADVGGSTVTETSTVNVTNSSLQQITAAPIAAVVGVPFTGTVASFTDPNPSDTASQFTATINWGNGDSTAGTVTSVGSGAFVVTGVDPVSGKGYAYPEEGTYNVSISVTGPHGSQFTAFTIATVSDAPITATGMTLGIAPNLIFVSPPFSGPVATFTSGNPNATLTDFSATISWGDGTESGGTISLSPTMPGVFEVSGTHQFAPSSVPYQAIITIKSVGGSTATAFTSITISDTPITPGAPVAITGIEAMPFTAVVGTFTDANPGAVPSQYATTINWGDGTSTSAGVVGKEANGTFTVTGSHTYAEESAVGTPYVITVTIADIAGTAPGMATDTGTATIADAALTSQGSPITGVEGVGLTPSPITVGTFSDSNPNGKVTDFTAVINWGDGTPTSAGTITQTGVSPNGSTFSVTGAHTYDEHGTYQTQVTITDVGGSQTLAIGTAVIADAALAPTATQPTVSTTEGQVFSGAAAAFIDANPTAPISDFSYVTIDWGDGTPNTLGAISQPGGIGTPFDVSATHTYAASGVNGGIGHYPITVDVHDIGGSTVTIFNTANVADTPLFVSGRLDPASDSGASNSDDITKVVQPTFVGNTNQPLATVTLYAQPSTGGSPFIIGQGVSNTNDAWTITSNQALANGSYVITAIAVDRFGQTTSSDTTIVPDLVIDTVGPKVTDVFFSRLTGQIQVMIQDFGGVNNAGVGVNQATLIDANNYTFVNAVHPRTGAERVNVISVTPGTTSGSQLVTLSINGGHYIPGGNYLFTVHSVSPTDLTGVQDIAGNALDGEFYGYFPSGNNVPGGDFLAELNAVHHRIFAPSTVIGRATPVSPPGTLSQGTTILKQTVNPSKFPKVERLAAVERADRLAVRQAAKKVSHPLTALKTAVWRRPRRPGVSVTR